jgi:hypothetical protein
VQCAGDWHQSQIHARGRFARRHVHQFWSTSSVNVPGIIGGLCRRAPGAAAGAGPNCAPTVKSRCVAESISMVRALVIVATVWRTE